MRLCYTTQHAIYIHKNLPDVVVNDFALINTPMLVKALDASWNRRTSVFWYSRDTPVLINAVVEATRTNFFIHKHEKA